MEKEEKMSDDHLRGVLVEIVENRKFPDPSFEVKHVQRVKGFTQLSDGKYAFDIIRDIPVSTATRVPLPSSLFLFVHQFYELDPETKEVRLVRSQ
ncbi:hypothetical protein ACFL0Q_02885 [Thermodesulfobacteriota bacterium]